MSTPEGKFFAIFCVTDLSNTREGQRLVVMRKFLNDGLGSEINVIHEFAVPDYERVGLVVLVKAPSEAVVCEAIKFCDGVFHTEVSEVNIKRGLEGKVPASKYAVFALNTPVGIKKSSKNILSDYPEIELWIEFPDGRQMYDVMLLNTSTFANAHELGCELIPDVVIETHYCEPLQSLFSRKSEPFAQPSEGMEIKPMSANADQGGIISLEREAVYAEMHSEMPFDDNLDMIAIQKDQLTSVSGPSLIWFYYGDIGGPSFGFSVNWSWVNNFWPPNYDYSTASNWGLPIGVIQSGGDIVYEFNTFNQPVRGSVRSPMSIWLHELMLTDKFDEGWPEDSYTGGLLKAYEYILSKLPGETPPNKGTLLQTGPVLVIDYPDGADFTKEEFKEVKDHLILEIGYFATAEHWFGINGVMDAINRGAAILSADALTEAANYMQIPVHQTSLQMTLDKLFGVLFSVISAIPFGGSALSAYLKISWTVIENGLPNGTGSKPIQAVIAEIADKLNEYLIMMETSAEIQREKLFKNWGKLKQFSHGVVTGIISEKMFLGTGQTADVLESDGPIKKLQEKVQASVADGWLIYCYQKLFTAKHQVQNTLSFSRTIPANPWSPNNGKFQFTWYVPCVYTDGKKGDQSGYMVFDCKTDAPPVVMEQFFGANARFDIVPIEFFAGLNGWITGRATYYAGYQNLTDHAPFVPVKLIGLKKWGDIVRGV